MNRSILITTIASFWSVFALAAIADDAPQLQKRVVELPRDVVNVAVGGSGRYLALEFSDSSRFGLFDLQKETLAFDVQALEEDALFSANRDSLIVINRESGLMQRWKLETGERLPEVEFPIDQILQAIATGAASSRRLMVKHAEGMGRFDKAHYSLVDLASLNVTGIDAKVYHSKSGDNVRIRASSHGQLYGLCAINPVIGLQTVRLKGDEVVTLYRNAMVGHVVPGPDGQLIFTAAGIFNASLEFAPHEGVTNQSICVPAITGPWFVLMNRQRLEVRVGGQVIATVSDTSLLGDEQIDNMSQSDMSIDKRIVLASEADRLAVLPAKTPKTIEIYDFGPQLQQSRLQALKITSQPPLTAKRGALLKYPILTTNAGKERLRYELIRGPDGMQITSDGVVTWDVPKNYNRKTAFVSINVSRQSRFALRHGFVFRITGN